MPLGRKVRLLIADKNPTACARLTTLAKSRRDIEVVGEAATGREVLAKAAVLNPDVVVVNVVSIPETAWLDFVEVLVERSSAIRAILAGFRDDVEHLAALLQTAVTVMEQPLNKERVAILLLKQTAALPVGAVGENVVEMPLPEGSGTSAATEQPLSPREREVLLLLVEGYSNREVAQRIFRSVKTVEAHRASIKEKLGLRNRADMVRYVQERGIISKGNVS